MAARLGRRPGAGFAHFVTAFRVASPSISNETHGNLLIAPVPFRVCRVIEAGREGPAALDSPRGLEKRVRNDGNDDDAGHDARLAAVGAMHASGAALVSCSAASTHKRQRAEGQQVHGSDAEGTATESAGVPASGAENAGAGACAGASAQREAAEVQDTRAGEALQAEERSSDSDDLVDLTLQPPRQWQHAANRAVSSQAAPSPADNRQAPQNAAGAGAESAAAALTPAAAAAALLVKETHDRGSSHRVGEKMRSLIVDQGRNEAKSFVGVVCTGYRPTMGRCSFVSSFYGEYLGTFGSAKDAAEAWCASPPALARFVFTALPGGDRPEAAPGHKRAS